MAAAVGAKTYNFGGETDLGSRVESAFVFLTATIARVAYVANAAQSKDL